MTTINSAKFSEICAGVWSDRAVILTDRGILSGETALVRAVYWRLWKAGVEPTGSAAYSFPQTILAYELGVGCLLELNARPHFDGAPFLKELLKRYQDEVGHTC